MVLSASKLNHLIFNSSESSSQRPKCHFQWKRDRQREGSGLLGWGQGTGQNTCLCRVPFSQTAWSGLFSNLTHSGFCIWFSLCFSYWTQSHLVKTLYQKTLVFAYGLCKFRNSEEVSSLRFLHHISDSRSPTFSLIPLGPRELLTSKRQPWWGSPSACS